MDLSARLLSLICPSLQRSQLRRLNHYIGQMQESKNGLSIIQQHDGQNSPYGDYLRLTIPYNLEYLKDPRRELTGQLPTADLDRFDTVLRELRQQYNKTFKN